MLFCAFLVWAVADRISVKRRPQRATPGAKPSATNDIIALGGDLLVYFIFLLWAHHWLIGVSSLG